jgi:hypothetical protein
VANLGGVEREVGREGEREGRRDSKVDYIMASFD